jgi:N-acetylglucosamine-6-phosphate deacetylase
LPGGLSPSTLLFCFELELMENSSITLIECVSNFLNWSGATIPQALKAVTATPAAMLGLKGVKGSLESDADADLCVISEEVGKSGERKLVIDQVWKFGTKVFDRLE